MFTLVTSASRHSFGQQWRLGKPSGKYTGTAATTRNNCHHFAHVFTDCRLTLPRTSCPGRLAGWLAGAHLCWGCTRGTDSLPLPHHYCSRLQHHCCLLYRCLHHRCFQHGFHSCHRDCPHHHFTKVYYVRPLLFYLPLFLFSFSFYLFFVSYFPSPSFLSSHHCHTLTLLTPHKNCSLSPSYCQRILSSLLKLQSPSSSLIVPPPLPLHVSLSSHFFHIFPFHAFVSVLSHYCTCLHPLLLFLPPQLFPLTTSASFTRYCFLLLV